MKIPYNWLKEYVDVKMEPERLADALTMAGLSVASIARVGSDVVFDIEITSNRPDWLSVIGVAREVAAVTGGKLRVPRAAALREAGGGERGAGKIKITVEDKNLCPRYTARIIRNVKIAESPQWLRERIEAVGLRGVNNIVDITNFCLFETGEPMHAFDLDKLAGGNVIVRRARSGEKIVTIDGIERVLDGTMLVIADAERPVAIAGVMGGAGTEVTAATKNILLEAACFDPVSIRRTSRKLALSTDSSYRFERGVDIDGIAAASDRAARLIAAAAGGAGGELFEFVDIGQNRPASPRIKLSFDAVEKTLGIRIPEIEVKRIVVALGMAVLPSASKGGLIIEPPSFRNDIRSWIDVVEEIARRTGSLRAFKKSKA